MFGIFTRWLKKKDEKLNTALQEYFCASKGYTSGSKIVMVVDPSQDLYDVMKFVIEKNDVDLRVIHMPTDSMASDFVKTNDMMDIKAVIVNMDNLGSRKPSNLVQRIRKYYPKVAVFVRNCPAERKKRLTHYSVGILKTTDTMSDYLKALGVHLNGRAMLVNSMAVEYKQGLFSEDAVAV